MGVKTFIRAGVVGVSLAVTVAPVAFSETLKVLEGTTAAPLTVPMNRAVVVEADQPFAELSIANPGIADISTLSDRTIYVLGKAPGRTTMTLLGPDGQLIANVDVQVSLDVAEFKERLQQILPNEKIEVRTANDGIVLSGVVSSIAKLDRALDLADRYAPGRVSNLMMVGGTQQVMLHVRFAEMQRSVSKTLSGSFGFLGTDVTGAANNIQAVGALISGGTAPTTDQFGAIGVRFSAGSVQMAATLEALEGKGLIRTLAEPNLTALSGQEAKFLAGGEYPIPVRETDESGTSTTIQYKPFGVELAFTPRVVDGDVINLALNTAVSGIDSDIEAASGALAFRRREAETTVEMHDGDSFAIAGLLQDDFRDNNAQVPWLGDIPILGALFRSAEYQRAQTELVVIVTAHLVSPIRGEALALPTDRVKPPSEAQLFLLGQTAANGTKVTGGAAEVARQDFSGAYGYVME
ncbi:type II and III secretion system protein family protein [Defluviimonas sp. WL0075]|uniref:Type II and III secretion system protein family protein n=1 Tax=Albidovulum sediminicola TaxID=2984331 RepID=A0ABT2Z348_9RHOB|nr:type II and III secretion system protein family protein [Defluviimonas sp. WL0075]MCV2865575.1 type II and III secretion system protein family protein [Defluviimonas sp. WL0075]